MAIVTLRLALDTARAFVGFHGLSFYGENGLSVEQICFEAQLRHGRIRVSTVGRLRSLGLDPFRSGNFPHLSVRYASSPTDSDLEALVGVFDQDIPNPYPLD